MFTNKSKEKRIARDYWRIDNNIRKYIYGDASTFGFLGLRRLIARNDENFMRHTLKKLIDTDLIYRDDASYDLRRMISRKKNHPAHLDAESYFLMSKLQAFLKHAFPEAIQSEVLYKIVSDTDPTSQSLRTFDIFFGDNAQQALDDLAEINPEFKSQMTEIFLRKTIETISSEFNQTDCEEAKARLLDHACTFLEELNSRDTYATYEELRKLALKDCAAEEDALMSAISQQAAEMLKEKDYAHAPGILRSLAEDFNTVNTIDADIVVHIYENTLASLRSLHGKGGKITSIDTSTLYSAVETLTRKLLEDTVLQKVFEISGREILSEGRTKQDCLHGRLRNAFTMADDILAQKGLTPNAARRIEAYHTYLHGIGAPETA